MNITGIIIGLCTFLIIGVFHPIVIKTEFYFGVKVWWIFLVAGIACIVCTLLVHNIILSALLGVLGFTCLWSIQELFEQRERVAKGWFPKGPRK